MSRFDSVHPDNTKRDRTVLYAICLTPGPYIDRAQQGKASRVGTSQPQAFAFDVHAAAKNCGVRGSSEEKLGRKEKGREKEEATQDPKTESIRRVAQEKPSCGKAFRQRATSLTPSVRKKALCC